MHAPSAKFPEPRAATRARRAVAEALGTGFLLLAVVGSGIMGQRLTHGDAALTLLANSLATAGALAALILAFAPISGAHFNPAVTLALAWRRALPWRDVPAYVAAQFAGAALGVAVAQFLFGLPLVAFSSRVRAGPVMMASEAIATFGLVGMVILLVRARPGAVAAAVGAYIGAGYWFTSSTAFANPAAALARALTDSFAGIRPLDVPGFVLGEAAGASAAVIVFGWLLADPP
ncbi:MAG TPA: aquaporin [Alphaproteobacteria bacterium]|nr:aquaporin [Alphaproteobacteria bacterium]